MVCVRERVRVRARVRVRVRAGDWILANPLCCVKHHLVDCRHAYLFAKQGMEVHACNRTLAGMPLAYIVTCHARCKCHTLPVVQDKCMELIRRWPRTHVHLDK